MSLAQLSGKVALITGSSSGIGAATAVLFAKLGASLSITGRNAVSLEATKAACLAAVLNKDQQSVLATVADVTSEADCKTLIDQTVSKLGKLDILVNNAGVIEYGSIENTSLEQYDRVMNANVRSVYHIMMLATPHLIQTKGTIVNVSSVNGIRSFPNVLAYNVSKAAVDQLTRCAAIELAPKQVRVNAVNPGVIVTELQKRGGLNDEAYQKFLEHSKTTHALGRTGNTDEVAEAIAFLASDKSSFITGVSLPVDGGRHVLCPR
ncbi:3-oxoacyl-[acyl-carrier-protein] reductase FabG [Halotydeus destructor]|nr:3-oxoacyl-[acyl-carrier-protein] reductase FabG [Halotydeus destructor]